MPAERETQAEGILAAATRSVIATADALPPAEWISRLQLVVEPRLRQHGRLLFSDSAQIDTLELGLLEENMAGPSLFQEQGFTVDTIKWKIRHVFGAKFLDWRGCVRMPVTP